MARVYRIGEAAKILNVRTSVLRFWESEFPQIRPKRTETGQRYYSEKDMHTLKKIHSLLYQEGMTISGAKKMLKGSREPLVQEVILPLEQNTLIAEEFPLEKNTAKYKETLHEVFCELKQLHNLLTSKNAE